MCKSTFNNINMLQVWLCGNHPTTKKHNQVSFLYLNICWWHLSCSCCLCSYSYGCCCCRCYHHHYFQFLSNESIFPELLQIRFGDCFSKIFCRPVGLPVAQPTSFKALKDYTLRILHSSTTFTSMTLTQTTTRSRLSSSVVQLQSKHQDRSSANKCCSEPRHKSAEDVRPEKKRIHVIR